MAINSLKLSTEGGALLQEFVSSSGIQGAVLTTAEGLELASSFNDKSLDGDLIASDGASLLSVMSGILENTGKGELDNMIISAAGGFIAVKDLGGDIALAVLAPSNFKMGGLMVALKSFVKKLQEY
jgi:predicted regulator of Ras-like GTPase activity (Roadblock/LC7/MglB family)